MDLLIVYLTQETKLQRSRTALRNFVAHHLKQRDEKDAALVAFVSPSERTWRFSFVKMEYATEQDERGKVAVSETLTPARRYSYLVGDGESCHTAQSRFLGLLQDTASDPTLEQIEEAFSVETVTKEFFAQYFTLFDQINRELGGLVAQDETIRREFERAGLSTIDFAKKLLGQIVFLYFIQKKGWLGVAKGAEWGTGPKDFLRRMVNGGYGSYRNFFNDVLEPLFYDTLATDRGHEASCNRFKCRLPFLNGGLFEPLGDYDWKNTDIILPNELFTNRDRTPAEDVGTGVLDVFDRYNFTVNEAEPLEQDVAIDPEMLGKVFENLIEENRRKGRGTFYTPREIVHYMCQESLVQYLYGAINSQDEQPIVRPLEIQEGLFSGTQPKQAVFRVTATENISKGHLEAFIHSGEQAAHYEAARMAGTVSYRPRLPSSIEANARLIDEHLRDIAVCDPAVGSGAFLVGMMTEIVRARSALTPYLDGDHDRTPYHFKRNAIQNCLYGVDIDGGAVEIAKLRLWLSLVVDEEQTEQIKPLPNLDFKIVPGNSLLGFPFQSRALSEIEQLKLQFFDEPSHDQKARLKQKIDHKIQQVLSGSQQSLGYAVDFDFELFFSEVFRRQSGFDVVIANPPYGADIDDLLIVLRPLYQDAIQNYADIYKMFMQLGLRKLKPGGIQALITPNTFLAQPRYKDIRRVLIGYRVLKVVNLGEQVFENVIVPTCLSFIMRTQPSEAYLFSDVSKDSKFSGSFRDIVFRPAVLEQVRASKDLSLYLGKPLRESEILFDDALEIKDAGIQYHRSGIGLKNKGGNDLYERLFSNDRKAFASSVPVWYGRLVDRWVIHPDTDEFFNLQYRSILKSNESASFTKAVFSITPKILWRQTASYLRGAIDVDGRWFRNTVQCAYIKDSYKGQLDIFYLLGVINSRYIENAYNALVKESGRVFPQVKLTHVKKLPLVVPDRTQQNVIRDLVKQILGAKNHDPNADVSALEAEINHRVDGLYGLRDPKTVVKPSGEDA